MPKSDPRLHRLTVYLGYNEQGESLERYIRAKAAELNLSVSQFIIQQIKIDPQKP